MAKQSPQNRKKRPSKRTQRRKLMGFAMALACLYFLYTIANIQIQLYQQRQMLAELQQQIIERQLENDELRRVMEGDGEAEYIERIAREKLGYAAPDERVFVDRSE